MSVEPLRTAFARVAEFRRELAAARARHRQHRCRRRARRELSRRTRPADHAAAYVEAIRASLGDFAGRIVLEPGRWLVAEAGVLLTRVIRIKRGVQSDFSS